MHTHAERPRERMVEREGRRKEGGERETERKGAY